MSRLTACPSIEDLWPGAVAEPLAPEVEAHVQHCDSCAARLKELAAQLARTRALCNAAQLGGVLGKESVPLATKEPLQECWPGCSPMEPASGPARRLPAIGKYLVLETLGSGGQATVYRALHPSLLVEVVIKLSHQVCGDEHLPRARFAAEAKTLAALRHPHLARVYDLDFSQGRPFLVLDYVRGQTLRSHRRRVRMDACEILRVTACVARAVAAAHQAGVLHLDLKPSNVIIADDGKPTVIDFGVSLLAQAGSAAAPTRRICGTPQYMAPEQARGATAEISSRTDVFGLGGILYFLCTLRDPYPACSAAESDARLRIEPDFSALQRSRVPRRLQGICRRALAEQPEQRYASAEELAEALEQERARLLRTKRSRGRSSPIASAVLGVMALLAAQHISQIPAEESSPAVRVEVLRDGSRAELASALPLRRGDAIRLESPMEPGGHVALLSLIPGSPPVWCSPLTIISGQGRTRAGFPRDHGHIAYEADAHAAVLLFLRREHAPIRRSDAECLRATADWPHMLPGQYVAFDLQEVRLLGRTAACAAATETWVRGLQQSLAQHFDEFHGVVLPPAIATEMQPLTMADACQ